MEIPEQALDEILLVDPQNSGYEDLPYDIVDEANKVKESDDPGDDYDDEWLIKRFSLSCLSMNLIYIYILHYL